MEGGIRKVRGDVPLFDKELFRLTLEDSRHGFLEKDQGRVFVSVLWLDHFGLEVAQEPQEQFVEMVEIAETSEDPSQKKQGTQRHQSDRERPRSTF